MSPTNPVSQPLMTTRPLDGREVDARLDDAHDFRTLSVDVDGRCQHAQRDLGVGAAVQKTYKVGKRPGIRSHSDDVSINGANKVRIGSGPGLLREVGDADRCRDQIGKREASVHHRQRCARKLPRQGDSSELETFALNTLGLNTAGGRLPRDSCGRNSL